MKKKILILAGGYSKERDISIQTAKAVFNQIKNKFNCKILDPKNEFIKKIRKFKPHVIFNALHGRYGEDGIIQAFLESLKIPYTHSGVQASSIAMDKNLAKICLRESIKLIHISTDFVFDGKKFLMHPPT